MNKDIGIYVTLTIVGIVLPVINLMVGAIYGALAFVLLAGVQISLLSSSGYWAIFGGKPTIEIRGNRRIVSIGAVLMLVSVLCGFVIKFALLPHVS